MQRMFIVDSDFLSGFRIQIRIRTRVKRLYCDSPDNVTFSSILDDVT